MNYYYYYYYYYYFFDLIFFGGKISIFSTNNISISVKAVKVTVVIFNPW